jgi:integrase
MSITLRPYTRDKTRFHVDMQVEHPTTQLPLRKRVAAPAGLDERQAHRWGEKELEKWLKVLALPNPSQEEKRTEPEPVVKAPPERCEMTLERFYREKFEPNYVAIQRPSTRDAYDTLWRNHLSALGSLPLRAIDQDRIDALRSSLARKNLKASSINVNLGKLGKMLRWAVQRKLIDGMPLIERVKYVPRKRLHYDEDQIAELRTALSKLSPEDVVVFLLAFECGLRTGEIAALCWSDINLRKQLITVERTIYRGQEGPAKGTIGDVGITEMLFEALGRLERRGPRVVYRCSNHTGGKYAQHSEASVKAALNRLQRAVNYKGTGLHILRHSGITFLADQGEDIYTVQAFARHARLKTTESYLHQSQPRLASKAARVFSGNRLATPGN